jgi:hypothetical protein
MEARELVLGDWSRPVRDPIDLLRLSYVVGIACSRAASGDRHGGRGSRAHESK